MQKKKKQKKDRKEKKRKKKGDVSCAVWTPNTSWN